MKTKPFDLEAAKAGAKVVTRDGRPVRIICWDAKGGQPIVAIIDAGHRERARQYDENGRLYSDAELDSFSDLLLVDEAPESELTEFEKVVAYWMETAKDEPITNEMIVDAADNLMFIARKELQKEQKPVPDKFSGLKSLMLQYLQSAANRKDDGEIESDTDLFGRKILDYVWKQDEKLKEQKPADWSDSVAKEMFIKALERAVEQTKKGYELTDCDKHSWWEDFKAYSGINAAELSEEDKRAIDRACVALRAYANGCLPEILPSQLLGYADKLQSLLSRPSWKPSEEQMKELEKVIKYQNACGLHASAGLLQELIDDLRKLL